MTASKYECKSTQHMSHMTQEYIHEYTHEQIWSYMGTYTHISKHMYSHTDIYVEHCSSIKYRMYMRLGGTLKQKYSHIRYNILHILHNMRITHQYNIH